MAKSIPAMVTPEVLQWARNLDMITLDEISLKLKVTSDKIEAWENGLEYPTFTQAKNWQNIIVFLLHIFIYLILLKKQND